MRGYTIIIILIICTMQAFSQNDTLVMKNGDVLVGEIKDMQTGVLKYETDYSDKDFAIEWNKISAIYTTTAFVIATSDGRRVNGILKTDPSDSSRVLIIGILGLNSARKNEIVFLKAFERNLLGRFDASFDLGISLAKANDLRQVTSKGTFGYVGRAWGSNASFDVVRSIQDSVRTRRTEANIGGRLLLKHSWFIALSAKFLQADEQKLKLRATTNGSVGYFFVYTNRMYFSGLAGLAWTNEQYTDDTPLRNSLEGSFGIDLNLFDIKDFSLLTKTVFYPSITERGRMRLDFNIDLKYDLPLDFYIKLGYTHNYDNQPASGVSEHDYVFSTTVGWEL
jgi:hypothetical protein